jgi:hypothetical protein
MKICVCGANNPELLKKVEEHYNVESVFAIDDLYSVARETYNYDDVDNVVFDGCVLDCIENEDDIHPLDEQIVLCALSNLDVVYVYTTGMTEEEISKYHQFDEFYPGKVIDVVDVNTFVIE